MKVTPEYLNEKFDLNDTNLVSVFDELPLWSSYFGAKLLDTVKFKKDANVLDIGSGTGFPLIEIAQRFGSTSKVYGIDPWKEATDRIRLKLNTMCIRNVEVLNQPAEELPFNNDFFDLIISNNGINNVSDPEKVLAECYRVSKPGAQFVMTVNLPGTMKEFYSVFTSLLKELQMEFIIPEVEEHINFKRKSVEENLILLTSAGFKINSSIQDKFKMRFIDGSAFLNHYFIKLAFLESWKKLIPESKITMFFSALEERLNEDSKRAGELKLTIPFVCINAEK